MIWFTRGAFNAYLFARAAGNGNLVDTALVASALKFRIQENIHNRQSLFGADETCGQNQHICIVVLARQRSNFLVPAECGTYALMLVEGDADAVSGSANGDSGVTSPASTASAHGCAKSV